MEKYWDYSFGSERNIFKLNLKEIWRYRDLLLLLVKRDFVSIYKQTILGPIWLLIQPLFTTFIYVFIFGNLAQLSTDGLPRPLFYLTGVIGWTFFSDCLTKTSTVFLSNSNLFTKVYFPRLIMPLGILLSSLVRLGIQFFLLVCLEVYFIIFQNYVPKFDLNIIFLPLIIMCLSMIGMGIGMIVSSLTTKYRDLNNLLLFAVQLFMYATPVVYPISSTPERYKMFLKWNPMSPLIEGIRDCLLMTGNFNPLSLIYPIIVTILIFFTGILVFNAAEKDFVDTI